MVKTIYVPGEITRIRDIMHQQQEIIANPSFEQGFAGWFHSQAPNASVLDDTQAARIGQYSMKFPADTTCWIDQFFPIALDPTWFTSLHFWLRSTGTTAFEGIRFYSFDIDGGVMDTEFFTLAAPNTWELCTITKPLDDFWGFGFHHASIWDSDAWIDNIFFVGYKRPTYFWSGTDWLPAKCDNDGVLTVKLG